MIASIVNQQIIPQFNGVFTGTADFVDSSAKTKAPRSEISRNVMICSSNPARTYATNGKNLDIATHICESAALATLRRRWPFTTSDRVCRRGF